MLKKVLTLLSIIFIFSCDDRIEEIGPQIINMWIDGEVVNVNERYSQITTYGSRDTYLDSTGSDGTWIVEQKTKKIFVIHFQVEDGRVLALNEHYALIFVDWDAANYTTSLINEGFYSNPHTDDKEVLLQIVGPYDYTIGAQASITELKMISSGQYATGRCEGSFYNPFTDSVMEGILEFENVRISTDEANTTYFDITRDR